PPTDIYTLSLHDALPIFEGLALGRPPAPVVYHVGVAEGHLVLQAQGAPVEHQLLELAVRGVEQGAAGRLVHAAGLHSHEAIFHEDRKSTRLNSSHVAISY